LNYKVLWKSFKDACIVSAIIGMFALICFMVYILALIISTAIASIVIPMEYILYISGGFSIFLAIWIIAYIKERKLLNKNVEG